MDSLEAISPIDGRYRTTAKALKDYFSESALMSRRVYVEAEYLIALSREPEVKLRSFSEEEQELLRNLSALSLEDAKLIRTIEREGYQDIPRTDHDVKAIEYFMREKLKNTSLSDCLSYLHFGLTSEDINSVSYALMLSDALEKTILPSINNTIQKLSEFSLRYKETPLLARTHGQPATPTTVGKEFYIFISRLKRQLFQLNATTILAKLSGASGNYNAHVAAYPEVDWIAFTEKLFISLNKERKISLVPNFVTAQIEPHDTYAELFDTMRRINVIFIDLCQDIWRYISDDWIKQKIISGEVGSSTMPHKINPIKFENCEGNLGLANALFGFFSTKLPISRLQRDLSDSTVQRNFGTAFAHCLVGYSYLQQGLARIEINEEQVLSALKEHPEVIAEAIQTVLRREGLPMPYEKLKLLTRGKRVTLPDLYNFIRSLDISSDIQAELCNLTPENYIGLAGILTERNWNE